MAAKKQAIKKTASAEPKALERPRREPRFSKGQLLKAERFRDRQDALNALLDDDKAYTVRAAEEIIEDFMRKEV